MQPAPHACARPDPDAEPAPSSTRGDLASEPASPAATPPSRLRSPHVWVSTTYFAEGFPYSIVNNLAEILFKELGASLQVIGLTSLFHLPWNLKFLWGPFIDHFETKRRWMIGVEVGLAAILLTLAFFASVAPMLGVIAGCFLVMAFLSATHDIAIDGFYLEGLDDRGQSKFVGYRAMAYKASSLVVRGPLVIAIGWVGWRAGLLGAALIMLLLILVHAYVLPRVEKRQRGALELLRSALRPRLLGIAALIAVAIALHRQTSLFEPVLRTAMNAIQSVPALARLSAGEWVGLGLLVAVIALVVIVRLGHARIGKGSYYWAAFSDFLARPQVERILAFVVLFRAGESFLQKMKWPFLRDIVGMNLEQYGFANGTIGVVASFLGTFLGGWLISRHGLRRWIWPFVLSQNVLNLLYMGLAMLGARVSLPVVTSVIAMEHFGEGLGTAVFMVYLMRCCDPAHKAAHMAILTALMSVSFTFAGVASGFLATAMGFGPYFGFTFIATLPGMILIWFIPHLDAPRRAA